jgi:hypothetical protein
MMQLLKAQGIQEIQGARFRRKVQKATARVLGRMVSGPTGEGIREVGPGPVALQVMEACKVEIWNAWIWL